VGCLEGLKRSPGERKVQHSQEGNDKEERGELEGGSVCVYVCVCVFVDCDLIVWAVARDVVTGFGAMLKTRVKNLEAYTVGGMICKTVIL
jgi:ssDNA-binding replication factor A large subunit